ncbi:translation initiation factor IF-2, chloroplastic [Rutidosis leptorrhynchoides]|uniref:translation initiation factor IF-2, chloroplastic n=1 Tax=Rutidosis leptorrhynchoides TaxID=125765 RepID=UPI003A98CF52
MASFASLVGLGSTCTCSSGQLEGTRLSIRRVYLPSSSCGFHNLLVGKRWRYVSICKYSVTTDLIADQGTSLSLNAANSSSKDDPSDLLLKPTRRPVLKPPESKIEQPSSSNNSVWERSKLGEQEERNKVIESLGEVLEKAEKLETSKNGDIPNKKPPPPTPLRTNTNGDDRNGPRNTSAPAGKAKTLKSVWRKGNPIATVEKVVKEATKIEKVPEDKSKLEEKSQPAAALRSPQRVEPQLQSKPAATPPVKRPVILKDLGAAPRPAVTEEKESSGAKTKERSGPILIDKFASKRGAVDPLMAQAVLAPPKPGKTMGPTKFREDFRKKGGAAARRPKVKDDEINDEETSDLNVSIPGAKKGRKWSKASRKAVRMRLAREAEPVKVELMEVGEEGMLVDELAFNLAVSEGEILGHLYSKGIKPDGVQKLDKEMVKMVCREYDVEVIDVGPTKISEMAKKKEIFDEEDLDNLQDRPPVLTIMGHVDHGKTTLLDYIRKSKVAASEAGGITQGIGAYKVQVPIDGTMRPCVFLDTPGHEAFGAMRARGARVTDIAIIVVAADDGMRPQTTEAIAHARSAGVPIVVAINKIDKEGASDRVMQVMQELSSNGCQPEDWGGDVPMVQISALTGLNVDDLLETTMLVAELQELKANPDRNAKGTVIEAGLDKSKGPVATFIVQNGTLKKGDVVVCGEAFGKVRALFDDAGKRVDEAGPSIPVQVIGLNNVPFAGDEFEVVSSLDIAKDRAEERAISLRDERILAKAGDGRITLSSFASAITTGKNSGLDLHQLNIVMKVDLQGSIEAVKQALQKLPQDNVTLKFILQATGDVSNSDVDLAVASKAIIFGFNVKASGSVKSYADNKGVEIRIYKVIYDLLDDMRTAMEGLLDPVEDQVPIGSVDVRAVFSSGSGRIAGCMVTEGKVTKDCGVRVLRKGKTIFVGVLNSLRRIKEDVKEVNAGLECGIGVDDFNEWEEGDVIEAFNSVQKRRTLEEASSTMTAAFKEAGIEI